MDFYLIAYILFSIILITSGSYIFMKQNKMIAVALYAIGAILLCVFYGLRWFKGPSAKKLGYDGQWPPKNRINMCPDYFTMIADTTVGAPTGSYLCVDYVGFSPGLVKYTSNSTPVPIVTATETNATVPAGANAIAKRAVDTLVKRCGVCKQLQITWEGVSDGSTCIGKGIQNIDSSSGGGSCPPV